MEAAVKTRLLAVIAPAILLSLGMFLSIPSSEANPTYNSFTEADFEADESCLDCHDEYDANLLATAHQLGTFPHNLDMMCISCHSGAAEHIEDPTVDNIGNPANSSHTDVLSACSQCHQPHMELDNTGFDPHLAEGLSCSSCHSVHSGTRNLMLDENEEFCGKCHTAVITQFKKVSNHPVTDGNVSCLSCHDFTGKLSPAFGHGATANCYSCHPLQSGPFLFEHEAASSFSTEGEGCVSCHSPHGSSNERLLTRTNNMLCRQCHATPPAHFTAHSGEGALYDCMDCHSAVHGSNINRGLLDPNLGSKVGSGPGSCFCHNVGG